MDMHILYGLVAIVAGIPVVVYAATLRRWFGRLGPAEQYLGPGGTLNAWKLIGLGAVIWGFWELFN